MEKWTGKIAVVTGASGWLELGEIEDQIKL